jgi:thiol-disulfide isomerase/thioredoxin
VDRLPVIPDPRPVVYFLHATGCPACEAARPEVGRWYAANKHRARVVPVDLTRVEWQAKAWEPDATPTCIIRFPDGRLSEPLVGYEPGTFTRWIRGYFP